VSKSLGSIQLPAAEVISRSEYALADLLATREKRRLEFVAHFTGPVTGWRKLFRMKPLTDEQAIERIEDDMWLGYEYAYLKPSYQSKRKTELETLINVGNGLLNDNINQMTVSIEIANVLYSDNM
jgi:hypothetical protein